jgi:hypothetical protein
VGHAIGAVAVAAGSLGWNACLLDGYGSQQVNYLLGLTHDEEPSSTEQGPVKGVFPHLELEHGDCIMAVFPFGHVNAKPLQPHLAHLREYMESVQWKGKMNVLSRQHVNWPIIYRAAEASLKPATEFSPHSGSMQVAQSILASVAYEPLTLRQVCSVFILVVSWWQDIIEQLNVVLSQCSTGHHPHFQFHQCHSLS